MHTHSPISHYHSRNSNRCEQLSPVALLPFFWQCAERMAGKATVSANVAPFLSHRQVREIFHPSMIILFGKTLTFCKSSGPRDLCTVRRLQQNRIKLHTQFNENHEKMYTCFIDVDIHPYTLTSAYCNICIHSYAQAYTV